MLRFASGLLFVLSLWVIAPAQAGLPVDASPIASDPTIADIKAELSALHQEMAILSERVSALRNQSLRPSND